MQALNNLIHFYPQDINLVLENVYFTHTLLVILKTFKVRLSHMMFYFLNCIKHFQSKLELALTGIVCTYR